MEAAEGRRDSFLFLGGIAGILAGFLNLSAQLILIFLAPIPFQNVETALRDLPTVRTALLLGVRLGYASAFLFVGFVISLYRHLRTNRSGAALIGVAFGVLGAAFAIAYALTLINAGFDLADLYAQAPAQDKFAVVAAATAALGIMAGLAVVGFFFLGLSFITLGGAMLGSTDFGRGYALASGILGVALVAAPFLSGSIPLMFSLWALFSIIVGWKVVDLATKSKKPENKRVSDSS